MFQSGLHNGLAGPERQEKNNSSLSKCLVGCSVGKLSEDHKNKLPSSVHHFDRADKLVVRSLRK